MGLLNTTKPVHIIASWLQSNAKHNSSSRWPLFDGVQVNVIRRVCVQLIHIVVVWQVVEIILSRAVIERPIHMPSICIESDVIAELVFEFDSLGMRHWIQARN